ncbi:hypothetical protein [Chryseobacterium oranimense]|jgi:hypothetical protein|uniref:Uncharacterized protein n=1 Tax=Chryseobacterium oranimense TaxID=421058 RepID=A0A1M5S654_9FLAO|nr:hypothetical protein [Chryseobacterium oranimense]CEJ71658.1 hypothetical protein BN1195_04008 [Chryseobacterium oranimense G311]SHH33920.1 hypothetical protein SAMN05421866_2648 [Chryseobacterium oranimense]
MMRAFFEMIFKRNEDAAKMNIWSLMLLISFAVFSVLVYFAYASKPDFNSLIVYLTAFAAYIGFGIVFISSLTGRMNSSYMSKKSRNI